MCAVSFQEKIELARHILTFYLIMGSFIYEDTQIILKKHFKKCKGGLCLLQELHNQISLLEIYLAIR